MNQSLIPTTTTDMLAIAKQMSASKYFADAVEAEKSFVKIMAGAELGIPPFQAMTGIHVISGKPVLGAGLIASIIKRSGKYTYRVTEQSDKVCSIAFFEGGEQIGVSSFTIDQAKKAGVKNLEKFAQNMLFARAISNGAKWYCPDIFGGPVYSEGEIEESPVQDTTAEVVHEAQVTTKTRNPNKRNTAESMKHFQETGSLPENALPADPIPDEKFVFDRIDEFTSNIEKAQDNASWDWNEQMISEDNLLSNEEKRRLIKASILHRLDHASTRDELNTVLERLKKFKGGLGPEASVVFNDLVEQANANGLSYNEKSKCFDISVSEQEPSNEELSQALADNG